MKNTKDESLQTSKHRTSKTTQSESDVFEATIRRVAPFTFEIDSPAFEGEDCTNGACSCRVIEQFGTATVKPYGTGSGLKRHRKDWRVRNAKSGNSYLGLTGGMQNVVLHISVPRGFDSEDKLHEIADELIDGYLNEVIAFEMDRKENASQ